MNTTIARPNVTLTSLVGARSSSNLPKIGMRPLQLETRMKRKNATNTGMCLRAPIPPRETAQSSSFSNVSSMKFW